MNIVNKTELKLEKYEKCSLICDNDCSLGMLYDYACEVQSFILQKMKEQEVKKEESQEQSEESKVENV